MAQEEIEIEIAANGKVTIRTIGIKGQRCLDVAESLVQSIGQEEHREITTEFYEAEQHVDQNLNIHDRYQ